jgi:hypothetical protein
MTTEKFEQWCIIGLFGHQKLAGRVSELNLAGGNFLQVDIPETTHNPAFTRIINPSAVYDINPVTEEVAKTYAQNLQVKPIESWDIHKFMEKVEQKKLELAVKREPVYDGEYEDRQREADHQVNGDEPEEEDD